MVMNPDYDLARPLASALNATAPYVGIPIPGQGPLIFNRSKLKNALNGVKPIYIAVVVHDNGERSLAVEGVASKHCRTSMRMLSLQRNGFYNRYSEQYKAMEKWNPVKAAAPRTTKHDKALAKLEKQLAKLGNRPKIQNPCLSYSNHGDRNEFLRWQQQKLLRQRIGKLAMQVCAGDLTARQFYVALAELTIVKRYSDFTEKDRERIIGKIPFGHNGFFTYADPKNLWKFLPSIASSWMHTRPRLYWGTWAEWEQAQAKRWGTARYAVVLAWSHARQEILLQIQAIKDMTAVQHPD